LAKIIYTYEDPVSEKDLRQVVNCLQNDGIIAYPTDVNWAFGALATSKKGLVRLLQMKPNHPKERPLALVFHSISHISQYAQVDNRVYRTLKKILPGPYTIILPRAKSLPKQLDDKRKLIGIRLPKRELVIELVQRLGVPLATTSLPQTEDSSQIFGYEVDDKYGHALDLVVDLGIGLNQLETTILNLSDDSTEVIRQGIGEIDSI